MKRAKNFFALALVLLSSTLISSASLKAGTPHDQIIIEATTIENAGYSGAAAVEAYAMGETGA